VTNKISKLSRSTAVAGLAAILTFGVASVHEAAAARVQRAKHRQSHLCRRLPCATTATDSTTGATGAQATILAGRASARAVATGLKRALTPPGKLAAMTARVRQCLAVSSTRQKSCKSAQIDWQQARAARDVVDAWENFGTLWPLLLCARRESGQIDGRQRRCVVSSITAAAQVIIRGTCDEASLAQATAGRRE
jgi:hypothetical protein